MLWREAGRVINLHAGVLRGRVEGSFGRRDETVPFVVGIKSIPFVVLVELLSELLKAVQMPKSGGFVFVLAVPREKDLQTQVVGISGEDQGGFEGLES